MNRHQQYNKYKRDKESQRFYNSRAWQRVRTLVLIRDYYLCQECLKQKIIKVYNVVHHIVPLKENKELSLDIDNLICLCHECHNRIENEGNTRQLNINIIEVEGNTEII